MVARTLEARDLLVHGIFVAFWILLAVAVNRDYPERLVYITLAARQGILLFASARAFRRPAYLTTDESGIGITPRNGPAEALKWNEIHSVAPAFSFDSPLPALKIRKSQNGKAIEIHLSGYRAKKRKELFALICEQASLAPGRYDRTVYYRSQKSPLPPLGGTFPTAKSLPE